MGSDLVPMEVATKDVDSWLDHKRVKPNKRKNYKEQIEGLVGAVSAGYLSLNDSFEFVLKLSFPIGESETKIEELVFQPRKSVGSFHIHLKGVKADDVDGRILAYVTGLTGKLKAIIGKLDSEDYDVCKDIAVFFL